MNADSLIGATQTGTSKPFARRTLTVNALVRGFLLLGICTSSIEILLTLDLGGFNTRLIYFFVLVATLGVGFLARRSGRIVVPYGFPWITAWVALNILYLPNAGILLRGLLFIAVLIASLLLVFGVSQVFRTRRDLGQLLKWYLIAFATHAVLGLGQLLLFKLAGINTVVESNGDVPRINGLTHEPSSFAAYEMFGYILGRELIRRGSKLIPRRTLRNCFALICASLILSTSKTGILFVLVYEGIFASMFLGQSVRRGRFDKKALATLALGLGAAAVFVAYIAVNLQDATVQRLISGSGIAGSPSHSFDDRYERSALTVLAASQHLLIGTSYGGGGVYLTQMMIGGTPASGTTEDIISPLFTPAEIVLATGLPGLLLVGIYFTNMMRRSAKIPDLELRNACGALGWSFAFGIAATGSDFTRAIIWAHVAVWSGILTYAVRTFPKARPARRIPGTPDAMVAGGGA